MLRSSLYTVGIVLVGATAFGQQDLSHRLRQKGAVKNAGGLTIAQDGESCAVNGMPKAAIDRGHALRVVSLDAMANTLQAQCAPERARAGKVLLGSS